jgi:hypothetical protein
MRKKGCDGADKVNLSPAHALYSCASGGVYVPMAGTWGQSFYVQA